MVGEKLKCLANKYVLINNRSIMNGTHMDIHATLINIFLFKYLDSRLE